MLTFRMSSESDIYSVVSDSLWPHGILQARILEWVAIPFSKGSSQPKDQTWVSCITGRFFTIWAAREAQLNVLLSHSNKQLLWDLKS